MSRFEVANPSSGVSFGFFSATTAADAVEACYRDAGYRDVADYISSTGNEHGLVAYEQVLGVDLERAIARSISHDEVVTVECDDIDAAYAEISVDADDYVDTFGGFDGDRPMREVWGTTDEGDEWRVHLLGPAA